MNQDIYSPKIAYDYQCSNDIYLNNKPSTSSPTHPKPGIVFDNGLSNYTTTNSSINPSIPSTTAYTPFNYVPTINSSRPSVPTPNLNNDNIKTHRRRKTGSKRSIDEVISSTTMHTNVSLDSSISRSQGPTISLLTPMTSSFPPIHDSNFMFFGNMPIPSVMPPFGASPHHPTIGPALPLNVPVPPLAKATPINPASMQSDTTQRPKKKSKYSAEQDQAILRLKKEGKSWSDISDAANCGNSLAARNRYQVLIGQQGGGAVVWDSEDALAFKNLLEEGEKAKWNYVAAELSRQRNKKVSPKACQNKTRKLFMENPASFGLSVSTGQDQFSALPQQPPNSLPPTHPTYQYPYMFNPNTSTPNPSASMPNPASSNSVTSTPTNTNTTTTSSNTPNTAVYMPYGMPLQSAIGFNLPPNHGQPINVSPQVSNPSSSLSSTLSNTTLNPSIHPAAMQQHNQFNPPPIGNHQMNAHLSSTILAPPTGLGVMGVSTQIKTDDRERL